MKRFVKEGAGWRLGWDASAIEFKALVGGETWAIELSEAEFNDFCRLVGELTAAIRSTAEVLMDEETIACEVESDLLWLEAQGYPSSYTLHLILLTGRRGEGQWTAAAVPEMIQALQSLQVF
jgi:hypothetical protein